MSSQNTIQDNNLFTYRRLRRAIGYLGIVLPVVLVILSLIKFFDTTIQPTISHFYYTNLREIFTGTLFAIGFFLICYKGNGNKIFWKNDNLLTNIAGILAIGIAFIPASPIESKISSLIPLGIGWLHVVFASLLFFIFAILSIFVFTIGQEKSDIPLSWMNENNIYKFCGYSIILFLILIPVTGLLKISNYSVLILETLILLAFGISWLIKGRALGDKGLIGEKLYREKNVRDTEDSLTPLTR